MRNPLKALAGWLVMAAAILGSGVSQVIKRIRPSKQRGPK